VKNMIFFLENLSMNTPENNEKKSIGKNCMVEIKLSKNGDPVSEYASQGWATFCIQEPTREMSIPAVYMEKFRLCLRTEKGFDSVGFFWFSIKACPPVRIARPADTSDVYSHSTLRSM
jgi:hypothetical protein